MFDHGLIFIHMQFIQFIKQLCILTIIVRIRSYFKLSALFLNCFVGENFIHTKGRLGLQNPCEGLPSIFY